MLAARLGETTNQGLARQAAAIQQNSSYNNMLRAIDPPLGLTSAGEIAQKQHAPLKPTETGTQGPTYISLAPALFSNQYGNSKCKGMPKFDLNKTYKHNSMQTF